MNKVATLKAQAKNLVMAMADIGVKLSHSQSLEAVAKQYGFENWDTVTGVVKAEVPPQAPRLADMPLAPINVWVEGQGPTSECAMVHLYDSEVLNLIHDPVALQRFLDDHADAYDGLDSTALDLFGDGQDYSFSIRDLLGITYSPLGGGNWHLKDGKTVLRFCLGEVWQPAPPVATGLSVPTMVKSAKGCKLLILTSHDGADYDKSVIVPPHLDIDVVKAKISDELDRLKAHDVTLHEDNLDDEYTEKDVQAFVVQLGCVYVSRAGTVGQNWD